MWYKNGKQTAHDKFTQPSGIGLQCNRRPTVMRQMAIAPDRVHVNIWRLEYWSDSRERKCITNDILLQKSISPNNLYYSVLLLDILK